MLYFRIIKKICGLLSVCFVLSACNNTVNQRASSTTESEMAESDQAISSIFLYRKGTNGPELMNNKLFWGLKFSCSKNEISGITCNIVDSSDEQKRFGLKITQANNKIRYYGASLGIKHKELINILERSIHSSSNAMNITAYFQLEVDLPNIINFQAFTKVNDVKVFTNFENFLSFMNETERLSAADFKSSMSNMRESLLSEIQGTQKEIVFRDLEQRGKVKFGLYKSLWSKFFIEDESGVLREIPFTGNANLAGVILFQTLSNEESTTETQCTWNYSLDKCAGQCQPGLGYWVARRGLICELEALIAEVGEFRCLPDNEFGWLWGWCVCDCPSWKVEGYD